MRSLALTAALAAAIVAGCAAPAWPKTAGETSCAEWSSQMSSAQRDALGTAILLALRADDGGSMPPRDPVIRAWVTALGDTCEQNPDAKISTVAATLYGLSQDLHP